MNFNDEVEMEARFIRLHAAALGLSPAEVFKESRDMLEISGSATYPDQDFPGAVWARIEADKDLPFSAEEVQDHADWHKTSTEQMESPAFLAWVENMRGQLAKIFPKPSNTSHGDTTP